MRGHFQELNRICPQLCPQMSRDDLGFTRIIEVSKTPAVTGFMRLSWTLRDFDLVEAAGTCISGQAIVFIELTYSSALAVLHPV